MAKKKQLTAYIVQRLSWEYGDDFYYRDEDNDAPVMTFLDRGKAEAHRRDVQWGHVREAKINPFAYWDAALEERTSLPMDVFLDVLREIGMDVGAGGDEARYSLYTEYERLPDEGRRLVWDSVDRFRFFTVLEMTVELDE